MTYLDKTVIGTGSYNNVLSGNTVSITVDEKNKIGNAYKKLAPRLKTYSTYIKKIEEISEIKEINEYLEYKKEIEDEYIKSYYETRLKNLYVDELMYELSERFGNNIILLCHENVDEFCHRRLVADYIELETGIYIPEVSVDKDGNIKRLNPIRYKNRLKEAINK